MMEINLTFTYIVCFKNCGLTEGPVAQSVVHKANSLS